MSENAVQEKPEEAHFTLDLAACARVLAKQQRKREEAALAKREAEERAVRAAVQRVLLNLPAALEVERDVVEVQVEDSLLVSADLDQVCRALDAYFGLTVTRVSCGWRYSEEEGGLCANRAQLVEAIERMVREAAAEQLRAASCSTCQGTHRMELRGDLVPCTSCPTPCGACSAVGSPYCKEAPCSCRCHVKQVPLLDLRAVRMGPSGDVVVADADLCDANSTVPLVRKGEAFFVEREARAVDTLAGAPFPRVKVEVQATGYQCFIAARQPAHVAPGPTKEESRGGPA